MSSGDEPAPITSVAILPSSGDQLASASQVFTSSHAAYPSWRAVFPDHRQCERALRVLVTLPCVEEGPKWVADLGQGGSCVAP